MKSLSARGLHVFLVLGVSGWFTCFAIFPQLFQCVGIKHYGVWFIDSWAILASNDAVRIGLDPYRPNPLDLFNRPHVYSHWWLGLHSFGLSRAHNFWVGAALGVAFLTVAVARLRPKSIGELVWYFVLLGSPPILLALNRANNDLVIFLLLAPVVPCLCDGRRRVRLLAVCLIALAAGLKFYPAAAGVVLLGGAAVELREVRARMVLALLALALVGLDVGPDLVLYGKFIPKVEGFMTFGAGNLPTALDLSPGPAVALSLVAAVAIGAAFWRGRWFEGWVIAPAERGVWMSFILGAVLLTACFFSGSSFAYRWIFALWLAPLLWRLTHDATAPIAVRRLAGMTGGLLLFSLWDNVIVQVLVLIFSSGLSPDEMTVRIARLFWVEQPLTWALFICLLGFLTHFFRAGLRAVWNTR
jgi:hypothetical protein